MADSAKTSVEPRLAGWRPAPSSLMGRPSTQMPVTPRPYPASVSVVAYRRRMPATPPSGAWTYGTAVWRGGLHPASDAAAPVARKAKAARRSISIDG